MQASITSMSYGNNSSVLLFMIDCTLCWISTVFYKDWNKNVIAPIIQQLWLTDIGLNRFFLCKFRNACKSLEYRYLHSWVDLTQNAVWGVLRNNNIFSMILILGISKDRSLKDSWLKLLLFPNTSIMSTLHFLSFFCVIL